MADEVETAVPPREVEYDSITGMLIHVINIYSYFKADRVQIVGLP